MEELGVTIQGQRLPPLIYRFAVEQKLLLRGSRDWCQRGCVSQLPPRPVSRGAFRNCSIL
jgi:hypothetical protein